MANRKRIIRRPRPVAAREDVALALRSWLAGDNESVRDLLDTTGDLTEFAVEALAACVALLNQRRDPDVFIRAMLHLAQNPTETLNPPKTRARAFLVRELGDGKPRSSTDLFDAAVSEGILEPEDDVAKAKKALRNAADDLGVKSQFVPGEGYLWTLPVPADCGALAKRARQIASS